MRILYLIVLITTILSIKGHTQTIQENSNYPSSSGYNPILFRVAGVDL